MALMYYNDNCSYELMDKIATPYTGGKIDVSSKVSVNDSSYNYFSVSEWRVRVGVKVVNCETGQVAWHLKEVRYDHMIYFNY